MVNLKDCKDVKDVRVEINRLCLVILLIFPLIYFSIYLNQNMEIPMECNFSNNFLKNPIKISVDTINGTKDVFINETSINSSYTIKQIEFSFINFDIKYNENDIMNAYFYGNSSSSILNSIMNEGQYIRRTFNLINLQDLDELYNTQFNFKIQKNYRLTFVRFTLTILGSYDVDFIIFLESNNNYKISNEKFIFNIIRLEYNTESSLKFGLKISIIKESASIFEIYNLQYR